MTNATCIITGADIVFPTGEWRHGDLFETPDGQYIFNATGCPPAGYDPLHAEAKALICKVHPAQVADVYVISCSRATLSEEALRYVLKARGRTFPRLVESPDG